MRSSTKALILTLLSSLILSSNTNAQWLQQNFPTNEHLFKVKFSNEMVGWILGSDFIYKTSDSGVNWVPQDSTLGFGTALYVLNDQVVFYSASISGSSRGIRRTTDGGITWQTVDSLQYYYDDFEFLNDQVGFVVGDRDNFNVARMTTDGGATWYTINTDFPVTSHYLTGITFADSQQGWIVTYDGYVYHTTKGGMNWAIQDSIRPGSFWYPIRDIFFATPDSGWAVGGIGGSRLAARTTDGGDNWIADLQPGNSLREVVFVDSKKGWFAGYGNPGFDVARTTNGGINWQYQSVIPPSAGNGFESITMINEDIGWMVGDFGVVYKTINGGVVAINEDSDKPIPDRFTLEQNYPNPFNPATRIHYSLPTSNQVTLRVYNIAGQVVATLVNERQVAGAHEVTYEAHELPAGLYFYRLSSGSLGQTRKMLLIK
jgi:photosystem II stability/assembly factor-like uncharacterized protein